LTEQPAKRKALNPRRKRLVASLLVDLQVIPALLKRES
jgi:hypothetical protein